MKKLILLCSVVALMGCTQQTVVPVDKPYIDTTGLEAGEPLVIEYEVREVK